jgi:hypothetical protein
MEIYNQSNSATVTKVWFPYRVPSIAPRASSHRQLYMADVRRGTRIACELTITLTSLDPMHSFFGECTAILVNPAGCAAKIALPVEVGTTVLLDLPTQRMVTAKVVSCTSLGEYEHLWLLGLALDHPGNVWGIEAPPDDWGIKTADEVEPNSRWWDKSRPTANSNLIH